MIGIVLAEIRIIPGGRSGSSLPDAREHERDVILALLAHRLVTVSQASTSEMPGRASTSPSAPQSAVTQRGEASQARRVRPWRARLAFFSDLRFHPYVYQPAGKSAKDAATHPHNDHAGRGSAAQCGQLLPVPDVIAQSGNV
jgi:hypothetical protein